MREKTLLAIVSIVDRIEEKFDSVTNINLAMKTLNCLTAEIKNKQNERHEVIITLTPREFNLVKNSLREQPYNCLFLVNRSGVYQETTRPLWSKVVITNELRTPGFKKLYTFTNGVY